ncbi:Phenylalanyl-tRNA synthetase, beta subunit, cytoplasmic [Microbotryomycetes sp. JL201]|nr:Phenylalanyl-tRNA synthetase, beta subunit, cytoplasmic [Microbotryomycetes sp. JL201]
MPTNRFLESGFWNFGSLIVLQQHPAHPVSSDKFPADYSERVKNVHESGGFDSTGYIYPFSKVLLVRPL